MKSKLHLSHKSKYIPWGSPQLEHLVRNMAYLVHIKNVYVLSTELLNNAPIKHAVSELPS